jgi:polysaccharide export outer membrane protein
MTSRRPHHGKPSNVPGTLASPMPTPRRTSQFLLIIAAAWLAGCNSLPSSGPSREAVQEQAAVPGTQSVQVVDVDDTVARRLMSLRERQLFSEILGETAPPEPKIGPGDTVEVNVWEAPPAALFGSGTVDPRLPATLRATTMPEAIVDRSGFITVPFAGQVHAAGLSTHELEGQVQRLLQGKANQPEVIVRLTHNASSNVTIVGEVNASLRMPLSSGGERLLDALAAAGGTRQPFNKITLQVTRGDRVGALPLDVVVRDPRQNVPLRAGDVVAALYQPYSFTSLGATLKNDEVSFETQGINLAQALARSGGVVDTRSDAQGVFVFRLERADALDWPHQPVATTPDGRVPVVYRINLRDPRSFFVMQTFAMADHDVLYVSNAPVAELQKFLNVVFSITYPLLNAYSVTR